MQVSDPRFFTALRRPRLLERIFTPAERAVLRRSSRPPLTFAIHWAAKEAAFKTVSKALGTPPTFHHRLFAVRRLAPVESEALPPCPIQHALFDAHPGGPHRRGVVERLQGEVAYEDLRLPLRICVQGDALHSLTWRPSGLPGLSSVAWGWARLPGEGLDFRKELAGLFTEREWACIPHFASACGRLGARRALAQALSLAEADLEIGCGPGPAGRRIPLVFHRGLRLNVDLSLSHHGTLVGWAFALPETAPRQR